MTEEQFVTAIIAASCDAAREGIITHACASHSGDLEPFAQAVKSQGFDPLLNTALPQALSVAVGLYELGNAAHDVVVSGLGLLARGDAERQAGRALTAMDLHQRAGEYFLRAGDRVDWARAQGGWLVAATHAGRVTEGDLARMAEARQALAEAGQTFRLAVLEQNIGLAYRYIGQYDASLAAFGRALHSLADGGSTNILSAMLLQNQAVTLFYRGDVAEAYRGFTAARALSMQQGNAGLQALTEINLAQIAQLRWQQREALTLLDSAISLLRAGDVSLQHALALIFRARVLRDMNRDAEALGDMQEAIAIEETLQFPLELAYALSFAARLLARNGRADEALAQLTRAEAVAQATGYPQQALAIALDRCELLLGLKHFADAYADARALMQRDLAESDQQWQQAELIAAEAALGQNALTEAEKLGRDVARRQHAQTTPEIAYRAHLVMARSAQRAGRAAEALAAYDLALQQVRLVAEALVLDQRAQFLEDKDAVALEALESALACDEPQKALAFLENSRPGATALSAGPQMHDDAQAREIANLRQRHRAVSGALLTLAPDSPAAHGAQAELQRLTRQLRDDAEAQLRQAPPSALAQGGAWAQSTTPILVYALLADDLIIFVVAQGQITARRVAGGARTVRKAERALRLTIDTLAERFAQTTPAGLADEIARWGAPLRATLERLWATCIAPVAEYLPPDGAPLILIPHGSMHTLPLLAMQGAQGMLAERWQVALVPALAALRPTETAAATQRVALGYSHEGTLPHAHAEAEMVAAILGGTAWVGDAANGAALTQLATGQLGWLHLAAHGAVRQDVPNASFIQLADGPLHPTDIMEWDLRGCQLVTLSACETGLGRLSGGDEQIGLTRAFGFAGAEALLTTLWRVDDASTFAFMHAFYGAIAAGKAPAEALRQTQVAFITGQHDEARRHPFFWAAFQLLHFTAPRGANWSAFGQAH